MSVPCPQMVYAMSMYYLPPTHGPNLVIVVTETIPRMPCNVKKMVSGIATDFIFIDLSWRFCFVRCPRTLCAVSADASRMPALRCMEIFGLLLRHVRRKSKLLVTCTIYTVTNRKPYIMLKLTTNKGTYGTRQDMARNRHTWSNKKLFQQYRITEVLQSCPPTEVS